MKTINIEVNGMHCMKCVAKVEKALSEIIGVAEVNVSMQDSMATIECLDSTTKETLVQAIIDCGFEAK